MSKILISTNVLKYSKKEIVNKCDLQLNELLLLLQTKKLTTEALSSS